MTINKLVLKKGAPTIFYKTKINKRQITLKLKITKEGKKL